MIAFDGRRSRDVANRDDRFGYPLSSRGTTALATLRSSGSRLIHVYPDVPLRPRGFVGSCRRRAQRVPRLRARPALAAHRLRAPHTPRREGRGRRRGIAAHRPASPRRPDHPQGRPREAHRPRRQARERPAPRRSASRGRQTARRCWPHTSTAKARPPWKPGFALADVGSRSSDVPAAGDRGRYLNDTHRKRAARRAA